MKNHHFADRNCRAVRRLTTPFRAAVVAVLAMAGLTCKDASGPSATSVVRIDISPDSALVFAGDFVQLTAVARNSAGAVISGKTFTWTILDPSIAAVGTSGRVSGMRLGRTSAIASSDGRADTAIVNVKVITSTTLSPQLDTLRSLNDSLQLAAQSFADAIQRTGQYTWQSNDATVATVSSTGVVVARMNGTVWIKASEAGGTLDSARIVVQQRLAQILVAPGTAIRPLGRTQQFTAQAVDARGNAVAGSVLIWSSRNPSIASVDATGLATGLAVGVATIEVVSGGVSGTAQFTVAPPPALIFSFTTTEVGVEQDAAIVGGSSLGISTSAPAEATLTVSVSNNAPGTATTSTGMTIAQGQSTAPLSVRGLTQGTARLIASAPGYAPDTADVVVSTPRLMVQRLGDPSATMTFSQTRQFQALVADSSGNLHNTMVSVPITVTSSNSAVLTVSTASLTIGPGGNASAAVTISPQGVGTAKVRITAPGYFDDSTLVFTVVAQQLGFDFSRAVIGLRQQSGAGAGNVILPETRPSSVVVTFTQKHPEFVQFPVQVTVPANSTTAAIGSWSGIGLGEDTVIATAFSFAPETLFVRVSTPQLTGDAIPASVSFTQPAMPLLAYAADTLANTHFAMDTVVVRVTSSNPTVLSPDSAYIHILKGSVSSTLAGIRVVGVGAASITLSDSAGPYLPYTTNVVTVSPAPLSFSEGRDLGQPVTVGMRQRRGINVLYVSVAEPVSGAPLMIALGNDNPTAASVPASVVIPVNGTAVSFDVTGLDTVGIANIVASTFGHSPDTMTVQVGVPGFRVETMTSAYTTSPPAGIYVTTIDQSGWPRIPVENVTATVTTSNAGVLSPDSASVTILAGQTVNSAASAIYTGAGTATLTASDARLAFYSYASGTSLPITVVPPPLSLDFTTQKLGIGQSFSATVRIPSNTVNPGTTVTVTHSNGAVSGTPAAVSIAAGQFSAQFQVDGLALGVDTIVVNATGYLPDTAVVLVEPDKVIILGLPATLSISRDTLGVRLQVLDPNGVAKNVSSTTTFSVFTSSHLAVNGRAGTSTAITVPAGSSISSAFTLTGRAVGTGLMQVTHSQFATVARNVSVTP